MEVSHRSSHGVIQNIQLCSPTRHQPLLRYTLRDHLALQALLLLFCLYEKKNIEKTKQTNKQKTTTTKNNYKKANKKKTNKQTNKLKFVSYQLGLLIKLWWLELFAIISNLFLNTKPPDLEIKTLAMLCFLLLSVTFKVCLSLGIRFCKFTTSSLAHPPA